MASMLLLACVAEAQVQSGGGSTLVDQVYYEQLIGTPYGPIGFVPSPMRDRWVNIALPIDVSFDANTRMITLTSETELGDVSVSVLDAAGKTVFSRRMEFMKSAVIDTRTWSKGNYLLRVTDSNRNERTGSLNISK